MGFIDDVSDASDISNDIENTLEKIFDQIGKLFDTLTDKVMNRW